ncbi:Potassium channel related protein [Caenispirillum salinarum AK4]|uniref:Potassium channel related protein n=1 Tax=Caenispirillum salinarum AK4 TaxID=1238182 RepID=K9GRC7_9PROT|nr:ion channel [Caenispirillum salinarum]EKV27289.1 Potassium channel related protein [Caenispirillum salinarum AK4]
MSVRLLLRVLYRQLTEVTWPVLIAATLAHAGVLWLLLAWAGETDMLAPVTYIYWWWTTSTTVGYGDISPVTDAGRMIVSFFGYTGGIAIFTAVIAKAINSLSAFWRRRMNGLADFSSLTGHTIIVGYHPARTLRMIDELLAGRPDAEIVLVAREVEQNPDVRVRFVRAGTGSFTADLRRAGLDGAKTVLIYGDSDDETLSAALAASAADEDVAIVAFFRDEAQADLLRAHVPRARCLISDAVEQVVREAQDPGAGIVLSLLSSTVEDAAVFSVRVREGAGLEAIKRRLEEAGAVMIGHQKKGAAHPTLLPQAAGEAAPGDLIHYIARARLPGDML